MHYNNTNDTNNMTDTSMTDPRGWAVQPASWANFDADGVVYCADLETAYRVAADQTRSVSYTHLTLPTIYSV